VAVLSDLLSRVRLELGDAQKQFTFKATGDGATKVFETDYKPVELTNLLVTVAGSPIAYPSGYTIEQSTGILTFVTAPATSAAIVVTGMVDRYFLDSELTEFINDAVNQHTYNRTDSFGSAVTLASISAVEEYPVAILASIEGLWALATDASFDIDISAPDGVTIPRAQRYRQITEIIAERWNQYRMLCSQLNIGLWRIEMGTLIRTSRTTNKYVPIYMGQEVDDSRIPERVYIQNDLTGRNTFPSYAQTYDIVLYQGNSYSATFDFPFDITGLEFAAQIRTYPNAPSIYANFEVTVVSASSSLSTIQLSLEVADTAYLPPRGFWDLRATSTADSTYAQTYIKGQVFTTQGVTDSSGAMDGSW